MVGYIDDFGALCRTELLADAQLAFRSLRQAIGVCLKPDKADAGNQIVFLGLKGTSPLCLQRETAPRRPTGREGRQMGR